MKRATIAVADVYDSIECRCEVRESIVVGDGGRESPLDPHDPEQTGRATSMIRVVMREHHGVDASHPGSRERRSENGWIGTGIDEQGCAAVGHEHSIPLTHIEHPDERLIRNSHRSAHPEQRQDQDGTDEQARTDCGARSRPHHPHRGRAHGDECDQLDGGDVHTENRTGCPREEAGDLGDPPERHGGEREHRDSGDSYDRADHGGDDTQCQSSGHKRQGDDVGERRDEREHPECGYRNRRGRGLGDERQCDHVGDTPWPRT